MFWCCGDSSNIQQQQYHNALRHTWDAIANRIDLACMSIRGIVPVSMIVVKLPSLKIALAYIRITVIARSHILIPMAVVEQIPKIIS
jgi:hypothetical protein